MNTDQLKRYEYLRSKKLYSLAACYKTYADNSVLDCTRIQAEIITRMGRVCRSIDSGTFDALCHMPDSALRDLNTVSGVSIRLARSRSIPHAIDNYHVLRNLYTRYKRYDQLDVNRYARLYNYMEKYRA